MNTPPILTAAPPVLPVPSAESTITYELTRCDLFINSMTVALRSRLVQIILLLAFLINGALILIPQVGKASLLELVLTGAGLVIGIVLIVLFFQVIMAFAIAFLMKQNGVVGRHTLAVTEAGLIERTDFNETLHKWPSIIRVMSLLGSVYIYVGEQNSHQVPRRCFSPAELDGFMSKLRAHCPQLK